MALIRHGSFNSFSAKIAARVVDDHPSLGSLSILSDIAEANQAIQPAPLEFDVSKDRRGLALKSLKLTTGFEGFLQGLFNKTNEIYFVAWSWDLSGAPIVEYPGQGANAGTCIIPLKVGQLRKFLGVGINLFPARTVTAGLGTRIMLWESDQGARDFGKAMSEVSAAVKDSKLNNLLSVISLAAGPTTATITLVKEAAVELAALVGGILQKNSDDYVDFYEGYYPAAGPWTVGDETHKGNASEITLSRFV